MERQTKVLYLALLPYGDYKYHGLYGMWKCIRINKKNQWSHQKVGQHWFGYSFPNDKFKELDIQEEFGGLLKSQRKIMRAVFGNYKGWQ